MIDRKKAVEVARDLLAMGRPPDTKTLEGKAVLRLIVERITDLAASEAHAKRAVRNIVDGQQFFPAPADIVKALEETPHDEAMLAASRACKWCNGDGHRSVDGPYGLSAAYPCDHRGGIPYGKGLAIPASLQRMYAVEQADGEARRRAWEKKGSPDFRSGFRITAADIERAKAERAEQLSGQLQLTPPDSNVVEAETTGEYYEHHTARR